MNVLLSKKVFFNYRQKSYIILSSYFSLTQKKEVQTGLEWHEGYYKVPEFSFLSELIL